MDKVNGLSCFFIGGDRERPIVSVWILYPVARTLNNLEESSRMYGISLDPQRIQEPVAIILLIFKY